MFYLFVLGGLSLVAFASAALYAVFTVSSEMDERVDQMRKQREQA